MTHINKCGSLSWSSDGPAGDQIDLGGATRDGVHWLQQIESIRRQLRAIFHRLWLKRRRLIDGPKHDARVAFGVDSTDNGFVRRNTLPDPSSVLLSRLQAHRKLGLGHGADLLKVLENLIKVQLKRTGLAASVVGHDVDVVCERPDDVPEAEALIIRLKGGVGHRRSGKKVVELVILGDKSVESCGEGYFKLGSRIVQDVLHISHVGLVFSHASRAL